MQLRLSLLITCLAGAFLTLSGTASAAFVHVVSPGESLSSIAAQDGLSVQQLAAANGLSPDAGLIVGSTVQIPPQGAGVTGAPASTAAPASTGATASSAATTTDGDSDADDVGSSTGAAGSTATATSVPASATSGAYVVQPGDTLSAIAARAGMTVSQLAADNGLDPNGTLVSGTVLRVGGGSQTEFVSSTSTSSSAASTQPVGTAAEGQPTDPPYPTPERVTAPQVGSIAAANGVPASLADAIAWQESGFNNDLVSSADARGVMQILPGTWQWIQNSLNPGPALAPASAADNVRGGVLMLRSLLNSTGGDSAMAAAGYYQGLPSVQQNGMYPSTQQYVQDVLSLEHQFGGGG